jgi:hypothetical protein
MSSLVKRKSALPVKYKMKKVKTIVPVAVLNIDELDRVVTCISMLINKDSETAQTKININKNSKKVLTELLNYRRSLTEYYKIETN